LLGMVYGRHSSDKSCKATTEAKDPWKSDRSSGCCRPGLAVLGPNAALHPIGRLSSQSAAFGRCGGIRGSTSIIPRSNIHVGSIFGANGADEVESSLLIVYWCLFMGVGCCTVGVSEAALCR
jgi:hypothetical protein